MAFCSRNYLHRCKITYWQITGGDNIKKKITCPFSKPLLEFTRATQSCRPSQNHPFHWHLLLNVACPGTVILNPLAWWVILLATGHWTARLLHPVIVNGFLKNGCLWLFTRSLQTPFSKKSFISITVNTTCFGTIIINIFNKFWFHHYTCFKNISRPSQKCFITISAQGIPAVLWPPDSESCHSTSLPLG